MRATLLAVGMTAVLATAGAVWAADAIVAGPTAAIYAVDAGASQAAVTPVRWYGYYPGYYNYRPYSTYRPYYAYQPYVYDSYYAPGYSGYYYYTPGPNAYYYNPHPYRYRYWRGW